MRKYINIGDEKSVKELLNVIIKIIESEIKCEAVRTARRYIPGNREGIMWQFASDYVGCSTESHISYILSSRLSSRPMEWYRTVVDQMSRLRVFIANGGNVYELFMKIKGTVAKEARVTKVVQKIIRKRELKTSHETMRNIADLNIGKNLGF